MSFLFNCGLLCALISVWGVLQLTVMSILYYVEAVLLIEDCEAHDPTNYTDFIDRTKINYKKTATNCLIAAIIYVLTLVLSIASLWKARKSDRLKAAHLEDDELSCMPPPPKPEIMVKHTPKTGILSKMLRKNKGKKQTAAQVSPRPPTGTINIKDLEALKDGDKRPVEGEAKIPVEGKKKKKKKKDKEAKKKDREGKKKEKF